VLYADRKTPDYRNSVKESISAIEAVAKIISGKDKTDLAAALKIIDANKPMHEAFKQVRQKVYGHTSDAKGVRHAFLDETAIDGVIVESVPKRTLGEKQRLFSPLWVVRKSLAEN
jgi:hypothetical protein